jgi:hypothetical protein
MKELRGRDKLVLYLDYDGVLHHENVMRHPRRGIYLDAPEEFTLFQHMPSLEALLAPYPEVRIVLSTSWVRVLGYSRTLKRLTPGLQARVIGATYHSRMHSGAFAMLPRGVQVLDDVERRRPADWIALDDDDVGWPTEHRDRLVLTDERLGLSAPGAPDEFKKKLANLDIAGH